MQHAGERPGRLHQPIVMAAPQNLSLYPPRAWTETGQRAENDPHCDNPVHSGVWPYIERHNAAARTPKSVHAKAGALTQLLGTGHVIMPHHTCEVSSGVASFRPGAFALALPHMPRCCAESLTGCSRYSDQAQRVAMPVYQQCAVSMQAFLHHRSKRASRALSTTATAATQSFLAKAAHGSCCPPSTQHRRERHPSASSLLSSSSNSFRSSAESSPAHRATMV